MSVNLSKSGASVSFGVRGAHYTVGPRGRRVTVGLPGTGMYYTAHEGAAPRSSRRAKGVAGAPRAAWDSGSSSALAASAPVAPAVALGDRPRLGFLRSLIVAPAERELVAGLRAFASEDRDAALPHLRAAIALPDAAFMAGMILISRDALDEARTDLESALANESALGSMAVKYNAEVSFNLAITPDLTTHLPMTGDGIRLALAEIAQRQGRAGDALAMLRGLHARLPDDVIVALSLVEALFDAQPGDPAALNEIVRLTAATTNLSPVHAAALLYRARALRLLGLPDASAATLTATLKLKQDRDADLMKALRYERALALDAAGQHARARRELEKLYSEDPAYEDIASRLGLTGADPRDGLVSGAR